MRDIEKPAIAVQVEPIEVVQANSPEPQRREYSLSLSYTGGRFATAERAERVADAIEKAISEAIKTA